MIANPFEGVLALTLVLGVTIFVQGIIQVSILLISPASDGGAKIFDVNIVIAIVAYALLSYLFVSLVRFIFYHKS